MSVLDTFVLMFEGDTKGAEEKIDGLKNSAEGMANEFKGLAAKALGAFGIALSAVGIFEFIQHTAKENFELEKLAARLGTTVEKADEFRDTLKLLGVSEETSTEGLKALNGAIADAAMGMGRAKKVFEELGVRVTDANGKTRGTIDVMGDLSKKMERLSMGQKIRIMERLGLDPSMLKMFNADTAELKKRMEEIDKATGFSLERSTKLAGEYTKAQKELGIEINSIRMYFEKLFSALAVDSLPTFVEWTKKAKDVLHSVFEFLLQHQDAVRGFFLIIAAAITTYFLPSMISAAVATTAATWPFILAAVVVAAFAAEIALLYDDLMAYSRGEDSVTGRILQRWPQIGEVAKWIGTQLSELWDLAKTVWDNMAQAVHTTVLVLQLLWYSGVNAFNKLYASSGPFRLAINALVGSFKLLGEVIKLMWEGFMSGAGKAMAVIGKILPFMKTTMSRSTEGMKAMEPGLEQAVAAQRSMAAAGNTPLAAMTSQSIANNATTASKTTTVSIEKVEVQTQATDAAQIAKDIGPHLHREVRSAAQNMDDGVKG